MTAKTLAPVTLARAAGTLLFVGGAGALMGIVTAESLYPAGYTTGGNMISDLGGTEPPHSIIVQPSAAIFDTTMWIAGILLIVSAGCFYAAYGRRSLAVLLALFGVGVLGVGVFPGPTGRIHELFALLAFVGGAIAAIVSYRWLTVPLGPIAAGLGAISAVNLVAYVLFRDGWFVTGLGLGGLERWIAYPIILWSMGFGGYLMAVRHDDAALRSSPAAVGGTSRGGSRPTPRDED
jgi:hypothetical membrane protein